MNPITSPIRNFISTALNVSLSLGINYNSTVHATTLSGAEYFIDATAPWCDSGPAPGSATALMPTDGVWDAIIETINLTDINPGQLDIGTHAVCVRFKSSTGLWGITRFATFNTGRGLAACEYYIDTDPGVGKGQNLPAKDGSFNSDTEILEKTEISATSLALGTHTAGARCRNEWGQWSEVKTANFAVPDVVPAPTCTTNLATNVTATSATLHGSVTSNNATATASFDFGTTTAYGTNIAAVPAQIYSSTPVAISANKTGLTPCTTYYFRTQAVASNGTCLGADKTFITSTCNLPNAWLYPGTSNITLDQPVTLDLIVNSDGMKVSEYNFTITIDPTKLQFDTTYQNTDQNCYWGICPGSNALSGRSVDRTNINTGTLILTGQDAQGKGPGNDLQLLVIHLKTKTTPGPTPVALITNQLINSSGDTIGLKASGATVNICLGICGDADGNRVVNIVDALAIARKLVNLPPPPTVNATLADTNKNSRLDINDALFIARYAVGLVLPPEACNIGQPAVCNLEQAP